MKVIGAVIIASFSFAARAQAQPCADTPPSRSSSQYWTYLEACGCDKADAPSRASTDYDRYLKVCSAWRERNQGRVLVGPSPLPVAKECEGGAPSRSASTYWTWLEA